MWFDANFFYDKTVSVVNPSATIYDRGVVKQNNPITVTINCDVQPTNKMKILKEYGIETNAQFTMFCDLNNDITLKSKIVYQDVQFDVHKIITWDDYMVVLFGRID